MQHELDTTEVGFTCTSEVTHLKPLTLDSNVSSEMFAGLAKVLNDTHVFTTRVTSEQVEAMLALKLSSPLKADVNRKVVTFFDALRSHNLIANNWQKMIADSGSFISSASNNPITYTSISTLLGATKQIEDRKKKKGAEEVPSVYKLIRVRVAQVVEESSTNSTNDSI